MTHQIIYTDKAFPPLPVFSQGTAVPFPLPEGSALIYTSGSIGAEVHPEKTWVAAEGIQLQTKLAMDNIAHVLEAAGASFASVVKVNIFITDMQRDFAPMNEVYLKYFEGVKPPARTCVAVAGLPLGALVEIECTAIGKIQTTK